MKQIIYNWYLNNRANYFTNKLKWYRYVEYFTIKSSTSIKNNRASQDSKWGSTRYAEATLRSERIYLASKGSTYKLWAKFVCRTILIPTLNNTEMSLFKNEASGVTHPWLFFIYDTNRWITPDASFSITVILEQKITERNGLADLSNGLGYHSFKYNILVVVEK